jgi:hypothetical protein
MTQPLRRKILVSVGVGAILIGMTSQASAVIPVTDYEALVQWVQSIKNQVEQYALQVKQYVGEELSWAKQLQQYALQMQQYENQLQLFLNFYHYPSLGSVMGMMNTVGLGSTLPFSPYAAMGLINGVKYGAGGLSQISGISSALNGFVGSSWSNAHVYTPTDASWTSQQVIANANSIAGAQGVAQGSYSDIAAHGDVVAGLRNTLLGAQDSKTVADATGQLQAEAAWSANEAAKMQATYIMYQAERDSRSQRDNEKLDQDIEAFVASAPAS